jgi:PAS domain S-box-containing protein
MVTFQHRRLLRFFLVLVILLTCLSVWSAAAGMSGMDMSAMHDHASMVTTAPSGSFLSRLFETSTYSPRRFCMNLEPDVIWTHVISDSVIALSYYTIPFALFYFVRRRKDLAFNWIFICFAVFILACGTTHVFGVIAIWRPYYRLDGVVKAITAIVSLGTAIMIWPLIPKALAIPSTQAMRESNEALQRLTDELERRVEARTTDLEKVNADLQLQINARRSAEIDQSRLAAIVESSNDAIIGKTLDGTITDWNLGAQTIFGYTAGEIVGKSILELIPPELHEEEVAILAQLRRGEPISRYETTRIRKDGERITVALTISPIKDIAGRIIGASKIARDITQEKVAEREREQLLARERVARNDAEAASRLKDDFVATLSHELRTPVNAVLGWTRVLRSAHATAEDISEGLEIIDRNTRVQVRLIEDLLDMSRILSGKLRLDVRRVDLPEILAAAIETVQPAAEAKEIRVQRIIDPLAGPVMGDANRLQQIVWNLLANAVKFTPRAGRVQIHLQRVNSHVEIVVSDSGSGIHPDFLPHVFERFRQQDASTTRQHGGLGLGLAIVRQLVELHGGTVHATSAGVEQGATFTVMLPISVAKEDRLPESRVHPTTDSQESHAILPRLDGLKVLVVDDEPDARALAQRLLQSQGAVVTTAGSASEAYVCIRENRPEVIVSDIGMPGEDGYAFIKTLRSKTVAEGGTIPAIALTAFARAEDRRKALMAGYQMHIAKPVEPAELLTVVASVAGLMSRH